MVSRDTVTGRGARSRSGARKTAGKGTAARKRSSAGKTSARKSTAVKRLNAAREAGEVFPSSDDQPQRGMPDRVSQIDKAVAD